MHDLLELLAVIAASGLGAGIWFGSAGWIASRRRGFRRRCFWRLAWYRLTKWMPRYKGSPEPDEQWHEGAADDPSRERGRSQ